MHDTFKAYPTASALLFVPLTALAARSSWGCWPAPPAVELRSSRYPLQTTIYLKTNICNYWYAAKKIVYFSGQSNEGGGMGHGVSALVDLSAIKKDFPKGNHTKSYFLMAVQLRP